MGLIGVDLDGVLTDWQAPDTTEQCVCISGRTWEEYDGTCRSVAAMMPLYIRGVGKVGDREHAGQFKATMIQMLGVSQFFEDDVLQADIIFKACPDVTVVLVGAPPET